MADEQGTTKRDVSKLPALIINNGLLATVAFATETNDKGKAKRPGMKAAMDSAALHLGRDELGIALLKGAKSAMEISKRLSNPPATAFDLQRASTETLAYLGYLKRFASKAGEDTATKE